ncbi:hypothetical protein MPSEU_001045100 [Mayamaea pseudoterrestris]|nr:hypothetical protein MPSEU_001045100 [Mayamaea pseudoterrestris]
MPNKIHIERSDGRELCPLYGNSSTQKFLSSLAATTCSTSSSSIFLDSLAHLENSCVRPLRFESESEYFSGGSGSAERSRKKLGASDADKEDDMLAVLLRHSSPTAYKRALQLQNPMLGSKAPLHDSTATETTQTYHGQSQQWHDDHDESLVLRKITSPTSSSSELANSIVLPRTLADPHASDDDQAIVEETQHREGIWVVSEEGSTANDMNELHSPHGNDEHSQQSNEHCPYTVAELHDASRAVTEAAACVDATPKVRRRGSHFMNLTPASGQVTQTHDESTSHLSACACTVNANKPRARRHGSDIMTMQMESPAAPIDAGLHPATPFVDVTATNPLTPTSQINQLEIVDMEMENVCDNSLPGHQELTFDKQHAAINQLINKQVENLTDGRQLQTPATAELISETKKRPRRHGSNMMTMQIDSPVVDGVSGSATFNTPTMRTGKPNARRHGSNMMSMITAHVMFSSDKASPATKTTTEMKTPTTHRRPRRHGSNIMTMVNDSAEVEDTNYDKVMTSAEKESQAKQNKIAAAALRDSLEIETQAKSPAECDFSMPIERAVTSLVNQEMQGAVESQHNFLDELLGHTFEEPTGRVTRDLLSLGDEGYGNTPEHKLLVAHDDAFELDDEGNIFRLLEEQQKERAKIWASPIQVPDVDSVLTNNNARPVFRQPKTADKYTKTFCVSKVEQDSPQEANTAIQNEGAPIKRVKFGLSEVRIYGLAVDSPRGPISSSKTLRSGRSKRHVVECPLTLDWAYASRTITYPALELGYTSYFCNSRLKPLSVHKRRLRVAAVNGWSWEELRLAEAKALSQHAVDLINASSKWKLLPNKHWHYQHCAADVPPDDDRWCDLADFADTPPVDRSRHEEAIASEITEWKRVVLPGATTSQSSCVYSSDNGLDAEIQDLVRLFKLNQESVADLDFNRSEWQVTSFDENEADHCSETADGSQHSFGESLYWNALLNHQTDATKCTSKPGEILSHQPTLLDSLDSHYRLHQGGRVAIARDGVFRRHEQVATTEQTESHLSADEPASVIPFELVPFANMDGLQLTEGRGMPDRRDLIVPPKVALVMTTNDSGLEEESKAGTDTCCIIEPRRARRRADAHDI